MTLFRTPKGCKDPEFKKCEVVNVRGLGGHNFQIIKIGWDVDGDTLYKIRHYNSLALFTGTWVAEKQIYRMWEEIVLPPSQRASVQEAYDRTTGTMVKVAGIIFVAIVLLMLFT